MDARGALYSVHGQCLERSPWRSDGPVEIQHGPYLISTETGNSSKFVQELPDPILIQTWPPLTQDRPRIVCGWLVLILGKSYQISEKVSSLTWCKLS